MDRVLIRCATFLIVFGLWLGRTKSGNHVADAAIWSGALILALAGLVLGYRRFDSDNAARVWLSAAALEILLCVVALRSV